MRWELWDGTLRLLARRIPSLRVYGKGPGQEFRLCFCFVKIHVSSATNTVSSSSQVEENSGQLSNAPTTSVCKVPAAQSYLDGGGAQARQCGFPRCAAACNAAAARITESAATSCGQGPVVPTSKNQTPSPPPPRQICVRTSCCLRAQFSASGRIA